MLRGVPVEQNIARVLADLPLAPLRDALGEARGYLVGGVLRDALLGLDGNHHDIDLAVDGDLDAVLARLDAPARRHERFGTASIDLDDVRADLALTRTETYPRPGALPEVRPAPIDLDLARRDFTVNAMAAPLAGGGELIDPSGGRDDLHAGLLRVLHPASFEDDPTRAIRAARYASRLGFGLEDGTRELIGSADLRTVGPDRERAELIRLAAEPSAPRGFAMLTDWGVLDLSEAALELIGMVDRTATATEWSGEPGLRARAIEAVVATDGVPDSSRELLRSEPQKPSEAARAVTGHDAVELLIAAAAGADWVGRWAREWRGAGLEIDGSDLIAAGIPEGPGVGAGLRAALAARLDGELAAGREAELAAALEAARGAI